MCTSRAKPFRTTGAQSPSRWELSERAVHVRVCAHTNAGIHVAHVLVCMLMCTYTCPCSQSLPCSFQVGTG